MNNELRHHGVKGQKWGVRRYRKYDGSYTKAGLKRYDDAVSKYERKKSKLKEIKSSGDRGYNYKKAKADVKLAKKEANKHYDHLKLDKRGDKGKIRYANGERIRTNNKVNKILNTAGMLSLGLAGQMYATNRSVDTTTKILAGIGGASLTAAAAKSAVNSYTNNQLRAYYSHTSKY